MGNEEIPYKISFYSIKIDLFGTLIDFPDRLRTLSPDGKDSHWLSGRNPPLRDFSDAFQTPDPGCGNERQRERNSAREQCRR